MIIENDQVIITSEASFYTHHNALGYLYHHNYWEKRGFKVKILYDDFYVDENLFFRHYEQLESAVEQFDRIKNLLILKPPYKNSFEHVVVGHDEFQHYKHRHHKTINDLYVKKFADNLFPFKKGVIWPMRNPFQRKSGKVTIMRTKLEEYHTPYPERMSHAPEWSFDWQFWEETLRDKYDVTEVNYRLPLSEILYHVGTSEFVFASQMCMAYMLAVSLQTPSMAFDFKSPSGLENYDHLIPKEDFFMLDDDEFLNGHINQAKIKVSPLISDWEKRFA